MKDTRVRQSTPILSGGVSRQPTDLRLPSQVQDASNVDFSIVDGLVRRVGTKYAATISGLTANLNYKMHAIERDGSERYLVIYGPSGVLKVYEILNDTFSPLLLAATVTISGDATTYLTSGSPTAADLSVITVADYTIIANKNVVPTSTTSADYYVTSIFDDWSLMTANTPTNSTYHKMLSDSSGQVAGYYQFSTGTQTFATWTGPTRTSTNWTTPSGNYNNPGNNPGGFRIGFQRLAMALTGVTLAGSGTTTLTKTGAFASYTPATGDMIYVTGGTGVTAGWATVDAKLDSDRLTITARGTCVLAAAVNATTSGIGVEYDVQANMDSEAGLTAASMEDVASKFQEGLRKAGCETGLVAWENRGGGGRFVVTAPWKGGDSAVKSISAPATGLYDYTAATFPFVFADGTATAGTGAATTTTQNVDERWVRTPPPNQTKAKLVSTTMPIKLVRSTFTGDGSTPATFSADVITWNQRLSGESVGNPLPPLVEDGVKITDILFHQDRLILAGGEHVCFSQNGDLFNFFIDNVANITDTDPINFPLSVSSVVQIQHLVPFRKNILVFTYAGPHFELSADGPFTPNNVVSTAATAHAAWPVRPASMDGRVYYISERGDWAAVNEYFYDDLQVNNSSADVTSHAPTFVPLDIKTIATVRHENAVIILPQGTSYDHQLYVYRAFWVGNRKEQSAWGVYTFDTGYRIVDIATIRNRCYMLVETSAGYRVEHFSYEIDGEYAMDASGNYIKHLDCQHRLVGVHSAGTTTFTLPVSDTTINVAVPLFTANAAVLDTPVTVVSSGTSVTVSGNYGGGTCIVGRTFTSSVELSRFYLRDEQGRAVVSMTGIVNEMHLKHHRTGPYTVKLNFGPSDPRSVWSETFAPTGLVDPDGSFKPWIQFGTDKARISIESSSVYPFHLSTIETVITPASTNR